MNITFNYKYHYFKFFAFYDLFSCFINLINKGKTHLKNIIDEINRGSYPSRD